MVRRPTKKDQQREASRAAYLAAGINLLDLGDTGISDLSPTTLSVLTGRTTGSFYNIWKNGDDYREELLQRLRADLPPAGWADSPEALRLVRFLASGGPAQPYAQTVQGIIDQSLAGSRDMRDQAKKDWGELFIRYLTGRLP